MRLDPDSCWQAIRARDRRFDGTFFVGVKTTGIYCRPICPARQPARKRCVFFEHPAEAEQAGFRACFRCRPELAPGGATVDSKSRNVTLAARRIAAGYLNDHSVDDLAALLEISPRHLRRAMVDELGVSPARLAQTQRLSIAKQLLQDTDVSLADIAFAAGFGSVRRFNALFRATFSRAPSQMRRKKNPGAGASITLRLDYRPPFEWDTLLRFLKLRAIPGVESIANNAYERTVAIDGQVGIVSIEPDRQRPALLATISVSLVPVLSQIVPRLRSLFDLDARPSVVASRLSTDRRLKKLVAARPGLRLPGAFCAFELGVRAILGQQVSVKGATTISGRFAERYGTLLDEANGPLTHVFPDADAIASRRTAHVMRIGLPTARAKTLITFSRAIDNGSLDLSPGIDPMVAIEKLEALPGIGPWTSQYVAMRALHWPNAFPGGDLVLCRALGVKTAKAAEEKAQAWEPWRAYAALHLWTDFSQGVTR